MQQDGSAGDSSSKDKVDEQTLHLASFPLMNPNPLIELDLSGSIVFMNPASRKILESLGMDRTPTVFVPADFEAIVGAWDKKGEISVYREVGIKDRTFAENVHLSPEFNSARIYAYDITEKKKLENALISAKKAWELTFDTVPDMIAILDTDHKITRVNRAMAERLGRKPSECVGMHCYEIVHGIHHPPSFCPHVRTLNDGREHIEEVYESKIGGDVLVSITPLHDADGQVIGAVHVARDITARKLIETEREATVEFLQLVNKSKSTADLIHAATEFFQRKSGCEAVGIRLRQEYDYPYYETSGFSKEFVMLENRLCALDERGRPIIDGAGNPALDCMCGNVICGRFDPAKPFFSKRGSFWANNTTRLLATTTEKDRQARTRNRCNGEGYESVALIGLTLGDERLGLLQLNDRRPDRFTPESIALWERLADYLAVALSKFRTDEALRVSEKRLAIFIEHAPAALAMFDRDMRYVSASRRWMSDYNLGSRDLRGLSHYDIFTEIPERWKNIHSHGLAGEVIKADEDRFDRADGSVQWLSWEVRPWYDDAGEVGGIVVFSEDITRRKQAEESLKESKRILEWERNLLQSIMNGARNAHLVYLDRDFNFVRVNDAYAVTCGYSSEAMIGKNHFDLYPHEENKAIFTRVRDYGEPVEFYDKPFRFPDQPGRGVTYWDWTLMPVKDSNKVVGLIFSLYETTERKQAEEAISRAMEELKIKNDELERFNRVAVGRELRMVELKKEVNKLCSMTGEPPKYKVEFDEP
ncbi:MAG TPA: PAS domain-containing protein [Dissulfurispiraceae bacterium]|nr:PAS domain-containing protein [Dissulfurispiraceae bacterium]